MTDNPKPADQLTQDQLAQDQLTQDQLTQQRRETAMQQLTEQREKYRREGKRTGVSRGRKGLLIVNTGNGKGKTTAALGLAMRAHGRGLHVKLFQFMKHDTSQFGEHRALAALGIECQGLGDGFTWRSRDLDESAALALHGWKQAKAAIASGDYDMVVLDEFTYPLKFGWVPWPDVEAALKARDPDMHVVVTGRDALPELVELADTVSEIDVVKHAYEQGIGGQQGIEY